MCPEAGASIQNKKASPTGQRATMELRRRRAPAPALALAAVFLGLIARVNGQQSALALADVFLFSAQCSNEMYSDSLGECIGFDPGLNMCDYERRRLSCLSSECPTVHHSRLYPLVSCCVEFRGRTNTSRHRGRIVL